jgi:hypothetical protein
VLVLGCIALLVMALMLMASFGVSNAIYERIRIQSHADAQAFSLATVEARVMNATAHYNRTIAAVLVAQMSLHSWMSIATNDVDMLNAGMLDMFEVIAFETLLGCYPPAVMAHCPCLIPPARDAIRFIRAKNKWARTLKGEEQTFNDGVKALTAMATALHLTQLVVLGGGLAELAPGGTVMKLQHSNAPRTEYIDALSAMNVGEFACALEGSGFDGLCAGPHQRAASSIAKRSVVMENVANAARPPFDQMSELSSVLSDANFRGLENPTVPKNQLSQGTWTHVFMTTARAGEGYNSATDNSKQAKNIGAGDTGVHLATVLNYEHTPIVTAPFDGQIYSDSNGGRHNQGHSGSHREFKGVDQEDEPCGNTNCFVNFRADADPAKDFGEPTVYGGATQDLRIFKSKAGFADSPPWELNSNRKVKIELVQGSAAEVDYLARNDGKGYAVSKAKVYFHQLGNWQAPPNLFDPFWRAKLHFFSKRELQGVVAVAGDPNGSALLGAGAPAEGEDR